MFIRRVRRKSSTTFKNYPSESANLEADRCRGSALQIEDLTSIRFDMNSISASGAVMVAIGALRAVWEILLLSFGALMPSRFRQRRY